MAEKKTTTKKTAAEPKKTTAKKTAAKKVAVALTAENVGFKAGDVYNALNEAGVALSERRLPRLLKLLLRKPFWA